MNHRTIMKTIILISILLTTGCSDYTPHHRYSRDHKIIELMNRKVVNCKATDEAFRKWRAENCTPEDYELAFKVADEMFKRSGRAQEKEDAANGYYSAKVHAMAAAFMRENQ